MKNLKVKDWFYYGQWYNINWFHSCFFGGLSITIKKRLGYGLSQVLAIQEKDLQTILISQAEWNGIGKRYLNDVIKNPKLLEKLLADIRSEADKLIIYSGVLNKTNFSKINSKKILVYLKKFHKIHHELWALGQVPNVLEFENSLLTDYLKDYLSKQNLSSADSLSAFQALTTPRELSRAQKEERELLAIASKNTSEPQLQKAVSNHWKKYRWIHFGWTGPSLTLEYFKDVCLGLKKEGKSAASLAKLTADSKQLFENKKLWIKKLKIDLKTQKLFRLLEELLFIKAHRMDALFISYDAFQPVLIKIARDHHLSTSQMYGLYFDDIEKMIKSGKVDAHKINEILKYSVQYFDGQKQTLLIGDQARQLMSKVVLPKVEEVNELSGQCGYPGKVTGKVTVVNKASEMSKFQSGDILVSIVTDPSLLPIMKKASAFVTNQGGLTCHAAIVARELKIPCVIGTKIATQIFKDGDMVEVDADNGKIRKI